MTNYLQIFPYKTTQVYTMTHTLQVMHPFEILHQQCSTLFISSVQIWREVPSQSVLTFTLIKDLSKQWWSLCKTDIKYMNTSQIMAKWYLKTTFKVTLFPSYTAIGASYTLSIITTVQCNTSYQIWNSILWQNQCPCSFVNAHVLAICFSKSSQTFMGLQ